MAAMLECSTTRFVTYLFMTDAAMITKSGRPSLALLSTMVPPEWSPYLANEPSYIVSCGTRKVSGARSKMKFHDSKSHRNDPPASVDLFACKE